MTFFLSCEASSGGASLLMAYHRAAEPLLNTLEHTDYGQELTDISITTIMVQKELVETGGYPERCLFQRKTHSADIRLRLDYMAFLCAAPEHRCQMYCSHILDSIETLRHKVSRNFRFHDLIRDVTEILESNKLRDKLLSIRRLP